MAEAREALYPMVSGGAAGVDGRYLPGPCGPCAGVLRFLPAWLLFGGDFSCPRSQCKSFGPQHFYRLRRAGGDEKSLQRHEYDVFADAT